MADTRTCMYTDTSAHVSMMKRRMRYKRNHSNSLELQWTAQSCESQHKPLLLQKPHSWHKCFCCCKVVFCRGHRISEWPTLPLSNEILHNYSRNGVSGTRANWERQVTWKISEKPDFRDAEFCYLVGKEIHWPDPHQVTSSIATVPPPPFSL